MAITRGSLQAYIGMEKDKITQHQNNLAHLEEVQHALTTSDQPLTPLDQLVVQKINDLARVGEYADPKGDNFAIPLTVTTINELSEEIRGFTYFLNANRDWEYAGEKARVHKNKLTIKKWVHDNNHLLAQWVKEKEQQRDSSLARLNQVAAQHHEKLWNNYSSDPKWASPRYVDALHEFTQQLLHDENLKTRLQGYGLTFPAEESKIFAREK